jgi:hypothetical protein
VDAVANQEVDQAFNGRAINPLVRVSGVNIGE